MGCLPPLLFLGKYRVTNKRFEKHTNVSACEGAETQSTRCPYAGLMHACIDFGNDTNIALRR